MQVFELVTREDLLQGGIGGAPGPFPILPVGGFGRHRQHPVRLGPRPAFAAGHGHRFELRPGESALQFDVGVSVDGELFLPSPAALVHAPEEHFAPHQAAGGSVDQPLPLPVDLRDPFALFGWNPEEGFPRPGGVGGIRHVIPRRTGHRQDGQDARAGRVREGVRGRRQGAQLRVFGDCDVGPPVHRQGVRMRIDDPRARKEKTGALWK